MTENADETPGMGCVDSCLLLVFGVPLALFVVLGLLGKTLEMTGCEPSKETFASCKSSCWDIYEGKSGYGDCTNRCYREHKPELGIGFD